MKQNAQKNSPFAHRQRTYLEKESFFLLPTLPIVNSFILPIVSQKAKKSRSLVF